MTRARQQTGRLGEALALNHLQQLGYREIARNFRCALGEVDLVARDGDTLVFLEIKTRRGVPAGEAKAAVNPRKQRQLSRVALAYMKSHGGCDLKARFDVVAVSLLPDRAPQIEVVRNAFELAW